MTLATKIALSLLGLAALGGGAPLPAAFRRPAYCDVAAAAFIARFI